MTEYSFLSMVSVTSAHLPDGNYSGVYLEHTAIFLQHEE